jgi:hypothetical protein
MGGTVEDRTVGTVQLSNKRSTSRMAKADDDQLDVSLRVPHTDTRMTTPLSPRRETRTGQSADRIRHPRR